VLGSRPHKRLKTSLARPELADPQHAYRLKICREPLEVGDVSGVHDVPTLGGGGHDDGVDRRRALYRGERFSGDLRQGLRNGLHPSAVCPVSGCNGTFCVDLTPTCKCAPAQRDGGASDGSSGFRCTWVSCDGILCPASTTCLCCGGFSRGCICSTACMTDADCTDPVRPVCDQGICSDGAFLCCGCP
jgi:hypothetical protein